ncbi:MAG: hypothetical protein ACJAU2_000318 [Maribacter sp.]|jgi:hypothetical protein
MELRGEFTPLFQIITVNSDTITYQAYTPLGSLYDAFDLVKDQSGKNKLSSREPETPRRFKRDFMKENR